MAVYDCCSFLNENDLYEIRLNQHWDFVDKFIVLEAGETHTGLKKPFRFDKDRFAKYSEKLIYRTFDSFEEEISKNMNLVDRFTVHDRTLAGQTTDDWVRDHFQGNYLFKILLELGAEDDDIILQSGLDEIIKKEAFFRALKRFEDKDAKFTLLQENNIPVLKPDGQLFQTRPIFGFELDTYVYKFNLFNQRLCVATFTELSSLKQILPATQRSMSLHTHDCIKDGGWHFTFFDDTDGEKVLEKQRSWAHSKDIIPGQKIKFSHTTKQEALERMFNDYKVEKVEITEETHPKYLIENLEKYKNYIF
jgi:beta-1,4-mannosyl-glycoprotein beta-1,4-N-acetylglucosaminyltransferase